MENDIPCAEGRALDILGGREEWPAAAEAAALFLGLPSFICLSISIFDSVSETEGISSHTTY